MTTSKFIKNCACPAHLSTVLTQATLTSGRMGAVVLVLVAMTAVGPTAGVTRTAPWFAGRDLQQQQYMTRIQITNKGPPITAAFVASDKSYHHLNIPTTKNTDTALLEDMFKQIKPALKQHLLQISLAVHFYPHPRTGHWKHKEWCDTPQIEMVSTVQLHSLYIIIFDYRFYDCLTPPLNSIVRRCNYLLRRGWTV